MAHVAKGQQRPAISGWVWLVTGVATGLLIALLVYLSEMKSQTNSQALNPFSLMAPDATNDTASSVRSSHNQAPRFTFYKDLPNTQIANHGIESLAPTSSGANVNNTDAIKQSAPVTQQPPAPPTPTLETTRDSTEKFVLQTDAFRNWKEADKRRAQLTLLGFHSRIESVSLNNDALWHRVLVGPYATRSRAQQAQNALAKNHIYADVKPVAAPH